MKKKKPVRKTYRFPTVRCTKKELLSVREGAKKAGITLSDYIRLKTLSGSEIAKKREEEDLRFKVVNELRKIGINLNQLTKVANSTGQLSPKLNQVYDKLMKTAEHLIDEFLESKNW